MDRTSKFAFAQLHPAATVQIAADFLRAVIDAVPYKLHTVLTDNGVQFGDMPQHRSGPTARYRVHKFDRVCLDHGVEHRFTKPNHPWTNGQVERMNRTLKEATVRRYHYDSHQQLRQHLAAFLDAYNFAKRLKTLQGLTPYEAICKAWADEPHRFRYDPTHLTSGPNTAPGRPGDAADSASKLRCAVRRPGFQNVASFPQSISASIGSLRIVSHDVSQAFLDNFAREISLVACPVPE